MKFKYLSIIVAVVSLVGLYSVSLLSQPTPISLSQLSAYNGQQVIIQGVVTEYRTTTFGNQLITIRDKADENLSALLYIEGTIAVEYGDILQAVGEVQQYKDQWELTVDNPQFVTIIQKWNATSFPLWQLAKYPERYIDTNVNITGVIAQKQVASFVLTDTTGTYSLEVIYDTAGRSDFSKGDTVMVAGRFIYDATSLSYVLKVTAPAHGIWNNTRLVYA